MHQMAEAVTVTAAPSVPEIVILRELAEQPDASFAAKADYTNAALALMPGLLEVVRATGLLYFRDDVVGCVALGRHALREVGIDTHSDYVRAFGA